MKKLIFISHIHEEKEVAFLIKKLIEDSFLHMIDVFVSSDAASNAMGTRWLDNISHALKTCSVAIIVCSSKSVARPWIHFEAGAGWVRDIPVIPICHSGLVPSKLPVPLNLLNAATASDPDSIKQILPVMAAALGSSVPSVDLSEFIKQIASIESANTFWEPCNSALRLLKSFHNELINHLKTGKTVQLPLTEKQIEDIEKMAEFLKKNKIIEFQGRLTMILGPIPTFECAIKPLSELPRILANPECKY